MAINVKRTVRKDPLKKIQVKKFLDICLVNRLSKKHLFWILFSLLWIVKDWLAILSRAQFLKIIFTCYLSSLFVVFHIQHTFWLQIHSDTRYSVSFWICFCQIWEKTEILIYICACIHTQMQWLGCKMFGVFSPKMLCINNRWGMK